MISFLGLDPSIIAWIFIALVNLATAVLTWRTNHQIKSVKKDVRLIEEATNGMKAELVSATAKSSFIEGKEFGRGQATTAAAELAVKVAAAAATAATAAAAAEVKSTPPQ